MSATVRAYYNITLTVPVAAPIAMTTATRDPAQLVPYVRAFLDRLPDDAFAELFETVDLIGAQ